MDHVHQLSLSWILAKGAHDSSELLGSDGALD
jgi:hypothetical protein